MASEVEKLKPWELRRFRKCPVKCRLEPHRITSLADYMSVVSGLLGPKKRYWFRGHEDIEWELVPSALRYKTPQEQQAARELLPEFQRIAEYRLPRPPRENEALKWMQLAQHYGIPTALLDWTESATFGLYFACARATGKTREPNGMVFLISPQDLSRFLWKRKPHSSLDGVPNELVLRYMMPAAKKRLPVIAINPVLNSDRLQAQRGVFTLHSTPRSLDSARAQSLVGIPILREYRLLLREELARIGVDEMTLFPELEHTCNHLRWKAGLDNK